MANFITLACPSCGGRLRRTAEVGWFVCEHCNYEHLIKHRDKVVASAPSITQEERLRLRQEMMRPLSPSEKLLAAQRAKSEIATLEKEVESLKSAPARMVVSGILAIVAGGVIVALPGPCGFGIERPVTAR